MPINISRLTIHAPVQQVWDALTKPELVKQWQYGSDLITDWNVGSAIRFHTVWGDTVYEQWGTVLEVLPLRQIRYSLFAPAPDRADVPGHYFVMSYSITGDSGKTYLEIQQEDNRPWAVQEPEQGEENPVLKMLKELAERK